MTTARAIRTAVAALALLTITGCATTAPVDIENAEQPEADGLYDVVSLDPPTDEHMCWQYSDTQTLIWNMNLANDEGRLVGNEWDGIVRLAMRQIDYIRVDPSTDVGQAIAALQELVPDSRVGGHPNRPDLDSVEWTDATHAVRDACVAEVNEWGTEGWVGG